MTAAIDAQSDAPAETAAWYWLAYESGLGLRRVKGLLTTRPAIHSQPLHQVLNSPPAFWRSALDLTAEEAKRVEKWAERSEEVQRRLAGWQTQGLGLLRLDEPGYPPTLSAHLGQEKRPILLSLQGDPSLLELPTALALFGEATDANAAEWTLETLLSLASEGVLPLAVARLGPDASLVSSLLQAEAPLALVMPRGLADYQPPPALDAAIAAGRALLLSPFRPDWTPPAGQSNPMLSPAVDFAQALANALLLISPPYPTDLLPEQPCFLRPGIPATVGCRSYYENPEDFFLRLLETPIAAAAAHAPAPLPAPEAANEPPLEPEALIARLAELGNMPDVVKARLLAGTKPSAD